jgi:hypothetical protein
MRTSGWTSPRVWRMLFGRIAPAGSISGRRQPTTRIEECCVQANPGVPDAEMVVGSPPWHPGRAWPPPLSEAAPAIDRIEVASFRNPDGLPRGDRAERRVLERRRDAVRLGDRLQLRFIHRAARYVLQSHRHDPDAARHALWSGPQAGRGTRVVRDVASANGRFVVAAATASRSKRSPAQDRFGRSGAELNGLV